MLTVVYCRVSTEEQAAEGFSIEGQAEKLRAYATLHELGPVTVIEDPGRSGKDLERPGLQRILGMVEDGNVSNVLVWRLDRLSRDLGDLILLADQFGKAGVGLHSFTERIDLSSATGRMFYHVLGSFAQFYREQLAENVRMGMQQAAREGKWTNRPKTGYDLVEGELVANDDASIVRRIFQLRAEHLSHSEISERTGIKHGTVRDILLSRVYLGEVLFSGEWYPGHHEPLITLDDFEAAHRGFRPGKRRGKDLLSGRVRCGLCGRAMSINHNGQGHTMYSCSHRGTGCGQPRRSSKGLLRAALLGVRLIAQDDTLQAAIRRELDGQQRSARSAGGRPAPASALAALSDRRRKLLELHYAGKISADLFAEEEQRCGLQIAALQMDAAEVEAEEARQAKIAEQFEEVLSYLRTLDIDAIWAAATDTERRVLLDELLSGVAVFPDHLEVSVNGAPKINVRLKEVGLVEQSGFSRVGGGT
jgi:DNA invertase Pin-like site-specific DNA recombinase